jgi:hypothetical protein
MRDYNQRSDSMRGGKLMRVISIFLGMAAFFPTPAADLGMGGRLTPFTLQDQRSQENRIDEGTRVLLLDEALRAEGISSHSCLSA